jgi:coenzyme F420-reducing hydrogenase alpha subunit
MAVQAYDPWMRCATHRPDGGRIVEIEIFDARGELIAGA